MNRWRAFIRVADNVVYLIPVAKVFGSLMRFADDCRVRRGCRSVGTVDGTRYRV